MASSIRHLRVPAVPASLDDIQDVVQELWACAGAVAGTDRIRFETAVAEIAGNIIEHSDPGAGAAPVTVTVAVAWDPGALRATFVDDGREIAVDLDGVGMPGVDAQDGRGLALALSLSDSVRYERIGSTNRWTVVCRRLPSPTAGPELPGDAPGGRDL